MFLYIISGLSVFLLILIIAAIKSASKDQKSQKELYRMLDELSAQVKEKNEALKAETENNSRLSEEFKAAKTKLEAQNRRWDAKAAEEGEAKKFSDGLKADIAAKEKQLQENKVALAKNSAEVNNLKELLKIKENELVSLSEAYNGLKEQYDDLEKQLVKINEENAAKGTNADEAKPAA